MGDIVQIVVPMSGFGERFRRAGYALPKPLIQVEGRAIIGHVIDMFPNETDFIFVCNQDHLDNPDYHMAATIAGYCPTGKVVGISPHKLGPIHAVRQIQNLLRLDDPVVVSYCDFTCYWNWHHFKDFVTSTGCDGAVPAYKGFHPHSLGNTNYAYIRETFGWMEDIQEKQPFTQNRMNEFASSGTYYFSSAALMLDAFHRAMEQRLQVGGEYYVSLAYKPLLADNRRVAVYPIQHFMQWGTPEDLAEYTAWSRTFRNLIAKDKSHAAAEPRGSVIMPMAGLGKRFADEGYAQTKPLIPVSGKPMVTQAMHDLPKACANAFILRRDMPDYLEIKKQLEMLFPFAILATTESVTEGQACTAILGLDALEKSGRPINAPITFGACDNGMLYDENKLEGLLADDDVDVIVWGYRGHPNAIRHPSMYGWIDQDQGKIRSISVKAPLGSPANDPIVIGTFTFKRSHDFRNCVNRLIAREGKVNGEYYIDSTINDAIALGLNCQLFEVDSYISWGTPNDLRTFEYWQSCFHKWPSHPYRLELDPRVNPQAFAQLNERYKDLTPNGAPVEISSPDPSV